MAREVFVSVMSGLILLIVKLKVDKFSTKKKSDSVEESDKNE